MARTNIFRVLSHSMLSVYYQHYVKTQLREIIGKNVSWKIGKVMHKGIDYLLSDTLAIFLP